MSEEPNTSNVSRPSAFGFGAAFDDRLFRIATGFGQGLTIETAPSEAPRVDTASSPEEIVEDFGRVFARSSFDGGEGLFRAHVEGAASNRFWDSSGMAVAPAAPGEFPEVTLSKATAVIRASSATPIWVAHDGGSLWVSDGTSVFRSDNPLADTPTFAADSPHGEDTPTTVGGLAVLGDVLYAALGANGIRRKVDGAWEAWSLLEATRLWAVQGRIVASDGPSLYEVVASGAAPAATRTLPSGRVWTGVVDAGAAVLASADDGYVYSFANEEGALALAAQTLFEGERPTAVGASRGQVAVGTRQGDTGRLWVGSLNEQTLTVDPLQLVREWRDLGGGVSRHPNVIVSEGDAFYASVPNGANVDVWRYELSVRGLSRHMSFAASECSYGLTFLGSKLFGTVCDAGLFRESDLFVDEGYLIGPLGDFYSASDKSWVGARLENGPLNGSRAELFYTTDPDALGDPDSSSWKKIISRVTISGLDEVVLENVVGRSLAGMVKAFSDTGRVDAPSIRSFGFRSFTSSGNEDVIVTLPVNISDQIERRGRRRATVRGAGSKAYAALKRFEGRPVLLEVFRPQEKVRGLVESVGVPVSQVNHRGSVTTVAVVRVRGRRPLTGLPTGGIITDVGGFRYHTFLEDGVFSVPSIDGTGGSVDVLLVGGGGGGGGVIGLSADAPGGGGGGGGVIVALAVPFAGPAQLPVIVGLGGATNANGHNSTFAAFTALGGGKGAGDSDVSLPGNGGSGGGANGVSSDQTGGLGTSGQGFKGGDAVSGSFSAGGGGATEAGVDGGLAAVSAGAEGLPVDWSGAEGVYGSGGGGIGTDLVVGGDDIVGPGGTNAGGSGSRDATQTFGGGGGGGPLFQAGGRGGSGRVVIRYPIPAEET